MQIELDEPALIELLGFVPLEKWVNAIREKKVYTDRLWELLRIQKWQNHNNVIENVKILIERSRECDKYG